MLKPETAQKFLKFILLFAGGLLVTAFVAVLLPTEMMAAGHEWLGLGEFPNSPITMYLARSTSLLYGIHGVLMVYTGLTMQHHWRLAWYFSSLHIVIGITMLVTDMTAGMPLYWILGEGPPVALLGAFMLLLCKTGYSSKT